MEAVTPRTRDNRMKRKGRPNPAWEEGDLTCPRCGWPAKYLIKPYHESTWTVHGGMCGFCCRVAAAHHDKNGWPPHTNPEAVGSITWVELEW